MHFPAQEWVEKAANSRSVREAVARWHAPARRPDRCPETRRIGHDPLPALGARNANDGGADGDPPSHAARHQTASRLDDCSPDSPSPEHRALSLLSGTGVDRVQPAKNCYSPTRREHASPGIRPEWHCATQSLSTPKNGLQPISQPCVRSGINPIIEINDVHRKRRSLSRRCHCCLEFRRRANPATRELSCRP